MSFEANDGGVIFSRDVSQDIINALPTGANARLQALRQRVADLQIERAHLKLRALIHSHVLPPRLPDPRGPPPASRHLLRKG